MENDIISIFLNRKKSNICEYAHIFVEYSLSNIKLNKVIDKIVEIYIDNYYLQNNSNYSLLNTYFVSRHTTESMLKDVLSAFIVFYINSGLESNIKKDINTIVIISNLIYLAVCLDEYIDEFNNKNLEIKERVDSFFIKYRSKIKEKEELEQLKNKIILLSHKHSNSMKKFYNCLEEDSFKLEFNQTIKNKNYYFINYNYNFKQFYRYDEREIISISKTKGIIDDIYTIFLNKLIIFNLKNKLKKHYNDKLFISIEADYFNKSKNINNLTKLFSKSSFKNDIIFIFEYKSIKSDIGVIKNLCSKGYKLALKNIPLNAKLNMSMFDLFDFVFINSKLFNKYNDFMDVWETKKINFIIDNEVTISIEENDILNRKGD